MNPRAARRRLPSLLLAALCVLSARGCSAPESTATTRKVETRPVQTIPARHVTAAAVPSRNVEPAPSAADVSPAAVPTTAPTQPTTTSTDPIARIRDEGMNRSQVMQTASYLMDVIGPRLTGSPNLRRANEWTRQQFQSWGLVNAHLEPWGKFGRGWSLRRFSMQIVEPQAILLTGCPKAWSPGLEEPIVADVVYLDANNDAELEKYRGTLKGKVVLTGLTRNVQARFEPLALRVTDSELLQLANAGPGTAPRPGEAAGANAAERRAMFAATPAGQALARRGRRRSTTQPTTEPTTEPATAPTTGPATEPTPLPTSGPSSRPVLRPSPGKTLAFLVEEGAAVVVTPSFQGDGGTYFIGSASIPGVERRRGEVDRGPHVWDADAPPVPPQVTMAVEDFNRLVRMLRQGESLKMAIDLQVQFHDEDLSAYNTVAEIPGTDLKDEVVMLGAHLDSWHPGTGGTDNGAGVAATMEAVRILKAVGLRPRRTVRIALWSGEEQGLYGSKGYVKQHFGYYPELEAAATRPAAPTTQPSDPPTPPRPTGPLVKRDEYDQLSAYFNLDHGTGKIRGVYMEGNEAVRPLFRAWLAPFADLGAQTLSLSKTGGTDHVSFDTVGLPGFQFIQDPIEYWSRTHHSNADVYDRLQADDLKQASVILAAFVYEAAVSDEKLPRKPSAEVAKSPAAQPEPGKPEELAK